MKKYVLLLIIIFTLISSQALAWGGPENVLVVKNSNSQVSINIADYYIQQRNIPAQNVLTITCQDSSTSSANERISETNYINQIETPIYNYIQNNGLTNQIQYIVLTKGIPHRAITNGGWGDKTVDSLLMAKNIINPAMIGFSNSETGQSDTCYANRYWNSSKIFKHSEIGGYIVCRLDGYTQADAIALIDRALGPQTAPYEVFLDLAPNKGIGDPSIHPYGLLLPNGSIDWNFELSYDKYNGDMLKASQILAGRPHLNVVIDQTQTFNAPSYALDMYCSWGSNHGTGYTLELYNSIMFKNGSIAETAVSSSGRTFLPTTGGQSLIADFISQGVAGAKGYATEPFLLACASPSVYMDLYSKGRNLAESMFAASRLVGWKDVILGDPLSCMKGFQPEKISGAKALQDGSLLTLEGMIVTAGTEKFNGFIYITDPDRTSGIRVNVPLDFRPITTNKIVNLRGTIKTENNQRYIDPIWIKAIN
ncbi:MAG: TIGR03790 family protein [Armatimonadota bacterium]